jgi:glucose/arabinose dehydrogenase
VQEGPDGALWVVTDHVDGKILRVTPMTDAR